MKKQLIILIFVLVLLITDIGLAAGENKKSIDLSESILKLADYRVHQLGEMGFAVYDEGEKKIKIFDWHFKVTGSVPIILGEGPKEIRQGIGGVIVSNDHIMVNGLFESKINIYDKFGKTLKNYPIKNTPYKMAFRKNLIHLINYKMTGKAGSIISTIIDPHTGKEIKSLSLKKDLFKLQNVPKGSEDFYGQWNVYDVDENGGPYLLIGSNHTLYHLDHNGKFINKVLLPYKHNMEIKNFISGKNKVRSISVYGWYKDMAVKKGKVYICYLNQVGKDKSGRLFYDSHILQLTTGNQIKEIILKGHCVIMGIHKGLLHVFNIDDYHVIPCDFSNARLLDSEPSDQ